ncbi:unnamed protein product [Rotaria sp. Silwood2]|nr:unnamed protein product [Rotaria sp. Silwood2]CAF2892106.1 unnamed protein product [Rotaria sp. Silwood2]CAF4088744.1 unnamed protein product [Rotaria sp. Silwood2]CAF4372644.1 unnamed protein product [Rotaria sp. Silwood2]
MSSIHTKFLHLHRLLHLLVHPIMIVLNFLLERYDYRLTSISVLCDVALLIFDYQLNLLRQIEVTGFKVSTDHFGGWLIADYNASCIWQIRRNEYLKPHKILNVERPWSVILDRSIWTLVTLSETQNRTKYLLSFLH